MRSRVLALGGDERKEEGVAKTAVLAVLKSAGGVSGERPFGGECPIAAAADRQVPGFGPWLGCTPPCEKGHCGPCASRVMGASALALPEHR